MWLVQMSSDLGVCSPYTIGGSFSFKSHFRGVSQRLSICRSSDYISFNKWNQCLSFSCGLTTPSSVLAFLVLQKNKNQTHKRPSDPWRSRRTQIYFRPADPDELVLEVLGPQPWGYRAFIRDWRQLGSKAAGLWVGLNWGSRDCFKWEQ